MQRELNVRIMLEEPEGSAIPDEFFAQIIKDAIETETLNEVESIHGYSITPTANPEPQDCAHGWDNGRWCIKDERVCPQFEQRLCKYFEPKRDA